MALQQNKLDYSVNQENQASIPGVIFILKKNIICTMNPSPWRCLLLVLLFAVSIVSQGAMAESSEQVIPTQVTSIAALETPPKASVSPTVKTTIAPIHTKERNNFV